MGQWVGVERYEMFNTGWQPWRNNNHGLLIYFWPYNFKSRIVNNVLSHSGVLSNFDHTYQHKFTNSRAAFVQYFYSPEVLCQIAIWYFTLPQKRFLKLDSFGVFWLRLRSFLCMYESSNCVRCMVSDARSNYGIRALHIGYESAWTSTHSANPHWQNHKSASPTLSSAILDFGQLKFSLHRWWFMRHKKVRCVQGDFAFAFRT